MWGQARSAAPSSLPSRVPVSGLHRWECHATPWAGMRTRRGQWVAAAGAMRGQPCPAVGAELPVRGDLAAAIEALVDELVKLLLELQDGGLLPALLGLVRLVLFVHGVPSVSHWPPADSSLRAHVAYFFISTSSPSAQARDTV
jgi:hypothetical protein